MELESENITKFIQFTKNSYKYYLFKCPSCNKTGKIVNDEHNNLNNICLENFDDLNEHTIANYNCNNFCKNCFKSIN